jgi:hypothetical protein
MPWIRRKYRQYVGRRVLVRPEDWRMGVTDQSFTFTSTLNRNKPGFKLIVLVPGGCYGGQSWFVSDRSLDRNRGGQVGVTFVLHYMTLHPVSYVTSRRDRRSRHAHTHAEQE